VEVAHAVRARVAAAVTAASRTNLNISLGRSGRLDGFDMGTSGGSVAPLITQRSDLAAIG
jgi:hypothetical protein